MNEDDDANFSVSTQENLHLRKWFRHRNP